jgi:hypothetical protein
MKKVFFKVAGDRIGTPYPVLLTNRHRCNLNSSVFHNNNYTTVLKLPLDYFKRHFKYEKQSGIYMNNLSWNDIPSEYLETICHPYS